VGWDGVVLLPRGRYLLRSATDCAGLVVWVTTSGDTSEVQRIGMLVVHSKAWKTFLRGGLPRLVVVVDIADGQHGGPRPVGVDVDEEKLCSSSVSNGKLISVRMTPAGSRSSTSRSTMSASDAGPAQFDVVAVHDVPPVTEFASLYHDQTGRSTLVPVSAGEPRRCHSCVCLRARVRTWSRWILGGFPVGRTRFGCLA